MTQQNIKIIKNMRSIYITTLFFLAATCSFAQNWSTFGGQSSRSGLSKITGPQNLNSPLWTVSNSNPTTLGNAVYTFGDQFVTSRVIFSPYTGLVECRSLQNGSLLWVSPIISTGSILYVIGYNEDGVYVHDYSTDTIYALHPDDGTIKWSSQIKSQTFGAYPGCVFACNGDLIVNGPVASGKFTMRLNKNTGDTIWTNNTLIAIGPAVGLAANETTVYRITGGITIPILLTAIDINTGITKYNSAPIPGDPDQENPITLGLDNQVYFWRDGGFLHAFNDVGNALVQDWNYIPQSQTGAAFFGNISLGPDRHLYVFDTGKIRRINHVNGTVIDSSIITISQGAISVGADSTVYVNDKNGIFYAFSNDLQIIKWQVGVGGNTYCNMALAKDGIMVFTGSGTQVTAHQTVQNPAPVADLGVSVTTAVIGQMIDFNDQSSFDPLSWQWNFQGGNPGISSLQNPTGVVYNLPGIYEVSLSVQNAFGGDSVTKTCYIEVTDPLMTTEAASDLLLNIYPNPSSSYIIIKTAEQLSGSRFTVFDMKGSNYFEGLIMNSEQVINISKWNSGMYLIKIENQTTVSLRFIKSE